jgi:TRAP-type C4-dicarboxylate transport system permease small subunit
MIKKFLDGTSNLLGLAAGCAVILMMLHINLDVAMRYIFSAPFPNTIEIVSSYYIVAIVFLPLALVERLNANIVVEILAQYLPKRGAELLIAFVALASAAYFGCLTWTTWQDAMEKYQVGEVALGNSQITIWPTRFYLPIGCGLLVLVLLHKAWRLFVGDTSVLAQASDDQMID